MPIHRISAVTSSSTSTGAARIASYVRWKRSLTKVPNIAGRALEKITAVATMPVPTNSTYSSPSTRSTIVAPSPMPNASRYTIGSSTLENVVAFQKVRKFATSRLMTPPMAAGSSLFIAEHAVRAQPRVLAEHAVRAQPRSSLRLLACEQHEHVLQRGGAHDRALRHDSVRRVLGADDRY